MLLKDFIVDCDDSFWSGIKTGLELTDADRDLRFTSSPIIRELMPIPLEKNTIIMKERAKNIIDLTSTPPQSVIEFGGAYGNLCLEYLKLQSDCKYSIVEIQEMLKFADVFLDVNGKSANLYSDTEINSAVGEYDLFLSWMAITETPIEYQEKVFDLFLPRCKYAIIGDMNGDRDQAKSHEPIKPQIPVYREIFMKYYGNCRVIEESLPHHHKNQIILFAERK